MTELVFQGILLGLTLSILIGPVFFELLQVSIRRGFKSGIAFALGIVLSDFTCILLAYLGVSNLIQDEYFLFLVGIIGGIVMIAFGIFGIMQKTVIHGVNDENEVVKPKIVANLLKAYFLNLATPFVFIFWLGATSVVTAKYGGSRTDVSLFFLITLGTIFSTDILKSVAALQLKKVLKPNILVVIRKIAGVILILFGVALMYRVIYMQD
ncbi:MAG: LysE family translocator [Bacteroidetes bacterium]|nr:LysE family translocator [Bacteroidota bacterium]MBU1717806.1 LysE family translocator [Bacteroidota bacterium]